MRCAASQIFTMRRRNAVLWPRSQLLRCVLRVQFPHGKRNTCLAYTQLFQVCLFVYVSLNLKCLKIQKKFLVEGKVFFFGSFKMNDTSLVFMYPKPLGFTVPTDYFKHHFLQNQPRRILKPAKCINCSKHLNSYKTAKYKRQFLFHDFRNHPLKFFFKEIQSEQISYLVE